MFVTATATATGDSVLHLVDEARHVDKMHEDNSMSMLGCVEVLSMKTRSKGGGELEMMLE